uniref:Uncharacterized protein n=1 Tax=Anguilla anguilla TaxID=7936 RepID=A0A0E9UQP4_ANGAN
MSYCKRVGQ